MSGPGAATPGRLLALRVAALVLGAAIGVAVERFAGTAWGFVAVPLAAVVGWWRFADPTQCVADERRGAER